MRRFRRQQPCWVYLVDAVGDAHVKVGYSTEPEKRLRAVQTGSAYPVRMYSSFYFDSVPAARAFEGEAHRRLREWEAPAGNEWFEATAGEVHRILVDIGSGRGRVRGWWLAVRARSRRFGWSAVSLSVRGLAVVGVWQLVAWRGVWLVWTNVLTDWTGLV